MREHNEAVNRLDVISGRAPITVDYAPGTVQVVEQHDGTKLALRKIAADYDVHDRLAAMAFLQKHAAKGQVVTGLLYVDREPEDLHATSTRSTSRSIALEAKELCPGSAALDKINASSADLTSSRSEARIREPMQHLHLACIGVRARFAGRMPEDAAPYPQFAHWRMHCLLVAPDCCRCRSLQRTRVDCSSHHAVAAAVDRRRPVKAAPSATADAAAVWPWPGDGTGGGI